MHYRQYRFKFYLNASHAIYINGNLGQRHPHTWEITINTLKIQNNFVLFQSIEEEIEKFMEKFQEGYLNEIPPFDLINPTLENCLEYFKDKIADILQKEGWLLLMIEMSETPTRSYVIDLLDEMQYTQNSDIEAIAEVMLDKLTKEIG